jgi:hypothetical protein
MLYKYNTTLFYTKLSTNPVDFDEVTGSPIFTEDLIALKLSMELDQSAQLTPQIGVDLQSLPVYGRFKEGSSLDDIKPNYKYKVEYEFKPSLVLIGELIIDMDICSRLGLEKYLGVPFTGTLTIFQH